MNLTLDPIKNIQTVKDASNTCYPNNPILADLTACQAILESNLLGHPSALAFHYNNLFGIKGAGTHGSIILPTKEYINDHTITVKAAFAFNDTVEDSFNQHMRLLTQQRYINLQTATSFEEAANMIREDGYATDPSYSQSLIDLHNKYFINK